MLSDGLYCNHDSNNGWDSIPSRFCRLCNFSQIICLSIALLFFYMTMQQVCTVFSYWYDHTISPKVQLRGFYFCHPLAHLFKYHYHSPNAFFTNDKSFRRYLLNYPFITISKLRLKKIISQRLKKAPYSNLIHWSN